MVTDKVVTNGYIKLLALSISHLETEIIMEKNTNSQQDIDSFKDKYGDIKNILIFIIHMEYEENDIMFSDYQKINENIHCFDYLRDIVTTKGGEVLERNDVINDFMRVYLWHLGTDNWDHSYNYYNGDGSETLNL